eukprot:TRINITY_DN15544_c0_g1_i1.p1 TRINITY_DN15544_c0_g1~~TRINITY_DN15544_c0_g1_i1.p1  ORF type:complete len:176 (+),score=1.40 TRINITY_DN15544_c0_g1_i1:121-648(+)
MMSLAVTRGTRVLGHGSSARWFASAAGAVEEVGSKKGKAKGKEATGAASGGRRKAMEEQERTAGIVEAALRSSRPQKLDIDDTGKLLEEALWAKEYSRLMMRHHHRQRGAESARLKLKMAAIEALPKGKLQEASLVPDFTPFPIAMVAPSLTPPIKEIQERDMANEHEAPVRKIR